MRSEGHESVRLAGLVLGLHDIAFSMTAVIMLFIFLR